MKMKQSGVERRKQEKLAPRPLGLLILNFIYDFVTFFLYWAYVLIQDLVRLVVPVVPKSLKNEIILVTGGGSGIGRALCRRLVEVEKSVTIITWDVNVQGNQETVKQVKALGVKNAYAFTVDVADRSQVESGASKIREEIGDVTMLFNNAGLGGELLEGWLQNPAVVEKLFKVNLISHFWTVREFLPKMLERRKGHIIDTSSVLGFLFGSCGSSYMASKFAVRGFLESIKQDVRSVAGDGAVDFSLVYPSFVYTNMTAGYDYQPKYPWMMPKLTPEGAAEAIVRGVRSNQAHIYIPGFLRFIKIFHGLLPPDVVDRLIDGIAKFSPVDLRKLK